MCGCSLTAIVTTSESLQHDRRVELKLIPCLPSITTAHNSPGRTTYPTNFNLMHVHASLESGTGGRRGVGKWGWHLKWGGGQVRR